MNIENERKLFEEWYESHHNGRQIACDYVAEDNSYSVSYANAIWVGWQASANREGFVLVEKELTEESINKFYEFWDDGPAVVWNEIIKSQENKDE